MFWERYKFLCEQIGKSPNAFAKEIGAKTSACTYWKNGTIPNGETLLKIASNFGCSVDYLLGRTDNPTAHKNNNIISVGNVSGNSGAIGVGNTVTTNTTAKNEQETTLLDVFNNLDPIKQAKLLIYADELSKAKE